MLPSIFTLVCLIPSLPAWADTPEVENVAVVPDSVVVRKVFALSPRRRGVTLAVETLAEGAEALEILQRAESGGQVAWFQDRLDLWARSYPSIVPRQSAQLEELGPGRVRTREWYWIPEFFRRGDRLQETGWIDEPGLRQAVDGAVLSQVRRRHHHTTFRIPDSWGLSQQQRVVTGEGFEFQRTVESVPHAIHWYYDWETTGDGAVNARGQRSLAKVHDLIGDESPALGPVSASRPWNHGLLLSLGILGYVLFAMLAGRRICSTSATETSPGDLDAELPPMARPLEDEPVWDETPVVSAEAGQDLRAAK